MNEQIANIQKKSVVIEQLKKYRPALIAFFQEVVKVNTEVQPQTQTKVINFNNDVIRDLPSRMRSTFMVEFEEWVDLNGRDFINSDDFDGVCLSLETVRTRDVAHVTVIDNNTGYHIVEEITYDDLAPFLQAGLDYHPRSGTFFVPRSC
ncbi:hypothetical protein BIZ78_gp091 [Erwinia phage vB_EamM_Caitlin]|uniref:hypothetical protein n=1 Tax=Erwinia phage vB_EamM_Caitlin TaxID=1883379 RepID=UPI00081C7595|nr:hypothetical protein BIZ78_gp091 [Erwinia phage vB_EamM_Caitlin]ANZ48484.1 hypothetical protein CAITLIN_189 [Erwinia phage vB_EamM_Caitlin]